MSSSPDKWALITGVSEGGLGDALTIELLKRGIHVIATALELHSLDYLEPTSPAKVEKLQLDVTSTSSISSAVTATHRITSGKLDFLVSMQDPSVQSSPELTSPTQTTPATAT